MQQQALGLQKVGIENVRISAVIGEDDTEGGPCVMLHLALSDSRIAEGEWTPQAGRIFANQILRACDAAERME